jgi:hypothetical protein
VVLGRPVVAVLVTLATAVALRILKWGRLPGYTLTLVQFLTLPNHQPALGYDRIPRFPRE